MKHQITFYMKPAGLTRALGQLVGETSAVVATVTDDGPSLALEVVPVESLTRFLEQRSVRRLHLLLGGPPKHAQDWSAVDKAPKKQMTIELGAFDAKTKEVAPSIAFALPDSPAGTLLEAFETTVKKASNKGVVIKDGKGRIKTRPHYWTPDLEGFRPKGYDTVFQAAST